MTDATATKWGCRYYQSGTMVVTAGYGEPWLYVYGPFNGDPESAQYVQDRMKCCTDLCDFLNGGERPKWLDDMQRVSETQAKDLDGTDITATGPMVDADPPKLNWIQDDSDEAKNARARLMDRLFLTLCLLFCLTAPANAVTIDHSAVCPAGTLDCTAAVQKLIDAEIAASTPARPAIIDFGPGTFPVKGLFVRANHLHPIGRIASNGTTLKLAANQGKYSRILSILWDSAQDSPPALIRGITFDGNRNEQPWDGSYNLEHQDGIFLWGARETNPQAGRLGVLIDSCQFQNLAGSGLYVYHQVKGFGCNNTGSDCFKGALHANGSEVDMVFYRFNTSDKSPLGPGRPHTNLQLEPQPVCRQSLTFIECDVLGFDLSIPNTKSIVRLIGCNSRERANINNRGIFRASGSTFTGGLFVTHASDAACDECTFIATDGTLLANAYMPKVGIWVRWTVGTPDQGQRLRLTRCRLAAADGVAGAVGIKVGALNKGHDNLLDVTDCEFRSSLAVGMSMDGHGGLWLARNNLFDSAAAFGLYGTDSYPYDVTLVGNRLGASCKTYIRTSYDCPSNKMRHVDTVVPAAQNVFVATGAINRLGLGQYSGGRTIQGSVPGLPAKVPGLPGDVFQDSDGKRWKVSVPSYQAATWVAE